jgi:hypothetical protein
MLEYNLADHMLAILTSEGDYMDHSVLSMCYDEYRPVSVTGLKGRSPIDMKTEDQEGKHNMQGLVGRVDRRPRGET